MSTSPLEYDAVVIGSGFGGAVAALRLSEKGYRVAVLEMGKRWRAEDFPETNWSVRKYLWKPALKLHGILQMTVLKHTVALHGAGVGGGSLVYAGTLVRPSDDVLRDARWPAGVDWPAALAPHYATARRMLGAATAPRVFPADEMLHQIVVAETGRAAALRRHEVSIYFGKPGVAAADPYFGGAGPERSGCIFCGACMTGCKHGAKNTLDRNYLWLAERLGCEIHPETLVTDVRPADGGGFEIRAVRSTSWFRRRPRTYRARRVVLAAGVLGTVKLLLQCKRRGRRHGDRNAATTSNSWAWRCPTMNRQSAVFHPGRFGCRRRCGTAGRERTFTSTCFPFWRNATSTTASNGMGRV